MQWPNVLNPSQRLISTQFKPTVALRQKPSPPQRFTCNQFKLAQLPLHQNTPFRQCIAWKIKDNLNPHFSRPTFSLLFNTADQLLHFSTSITKPPPQPQPANGLTTTKDPSFHPFHTRESPAR
ncbi:hypothetical protein SLE2022_358270 [Rubroshorea leprosula]